MLIRTAVTGAGGWHLPQTNQCRTPADDHDIKGAILFGVDSLLITSGIHQSSFDNIRPKWNTIKNQVKNLGITPTFLCSKFQL